MKWKMNFRPIWKPIKFIIHTYWNVKLHFCTCMLYLKRLNVLVDLIQLTSNEQFLKHNYTHTEFMSLKVTVYLLLTSCVSGVFTFLKLSSTSFVKIVFCVKTLSIFLPEAFMSLEHTWTIPWLKISITKFILMRQAGI